MTPAERFQLCYSMAANIVAAYRADAPEGCDPQNSYVALATVVIGAGTAAYSASQQKKAANKAASASQGAKYKPIQIPKMPGFVRAEPVGMNEIGTAFDRLAYARSDADFKKRHGGIVQAENLFEQQVLKDQQGEHELMPAVQNEFQRAGLEGALTAFGDTPGTLAPGSAGEAAVARNLGLSILGFQDRNRTNRTNSIVTAQSLFPRRTFGLSGADAVQMEVANIAGRNNWNQADHASKVQEMQFNATGGANFANAQQAQANVTAQANAQSNAEMNRAIMSSVEMAGKLYMQQRQQNQQPGTVSVSTAAKAA